MRDSLQRSASFRIAICFGIVIGMCGTPGAAPAAPSAKSPPRPSHAHHVPVNRHTHSSPQISKSTYYHGRTTPHGVIVTRTIWLRHGHVPRLRATITGTVHNTVGPIAAAQVRLAKPGGRRIKNPHARHATTTNSGGIFSMHNVKAGRYRVVASRSGAGHGHAPVAFHTAGIQRVDIKLSAPVPKKKKRK